MACLPGTDASSVYGCGYCLSSCVPALTGEVAAHAAGHDHHVRRGLSQSDPAELPRHGRVLRLKLGRKDFETVLSWRARRLAHSGELEAAAMVHGFKHLTRDLRLH